VTRRWRTKMVGSHSNERYVLIDRCIRFVWRYYSPNASQVGHSTSTHYWICYCRHFTRVRRDQLDGVFSRTKWSRFAISNRIFLLTFWVIGSICTRAGSMHRCRTYWRFHSFPSAYSPFRNGIVVHPCHSTSNFHYFPPNREIFRHKRNAKCRP
jgi:hypothetical protein